MSINMNYYFTGILILGFLFLAFCMGPIWKYPKTHQ